MPASSDPPSRASKKATWKKKTTSFKKSGSAQPTFAEKVEAALAAKNEKKPTFAEKVEAALAAKTGTPSSTNEKTGGPSSKITDTGNDQPSVIMVDGKRVIRFDHLTNIRGLSDVKGQQTPLQAQKVLSHLFLHNSKP